jgi:hypothetical protein
VSALASGAMFFLWRRMNSEGRQRVWRLYGWYSGLMMCGSCFGAVSWAARMMNLVYGFRANHLILLGNNAEGASFWSLSSRYWRPLHTVMYSVEFMCLSMARLIVLDRMLRLTAPQGEDRRRWVKFGWILIAVVLLGNSVASAANVAVAAHYNKAGEAFGVASEFFFANNTKDGKQYNSIANLELQLAGSVASVQSFCEVAVLLLIVAAFAVVGIVRVRQLTSALTVLHSSGQDIATGMQIQRSVIAVAMALGRQLQQEIVLTTGFVFVAFVLRSIFSTMHAVVYQLRDVGKTCPEAKSSCDASCYNVYVPPQGLNLKTLWHYFHDANRYTHASRWMFFTPEFQLTVILVSSPLALLVALWGSTSVAILKFRPFRQHTPASDNSRPALITLQL